MIEQINTNIYTEYLKIFNRQMDIINRICYKTIHIAKHRFRIYEKILILQKDEV